MHGRESIVLDSNFSNGSFDGFTCFEISWIKNHIFSCWYIRVFIINATSKQIIETTPNLVSTFASDVDATCNFLRRSNVKILGSGF